MGKVKRGGSGGEEEGEREKGREEIGGEGREEGWKRRRWREKGEWMTRT